MPGRRCARPAAWPPSCCPRVPLVGWALGRERGRERACPTGLAWAAWLAATGIAVSGLGKATAGGYSNAFIPGIYFSSLLVGVAVARLAGGSEEDARAPRRATITWALMAATIVLAPRVLQHALQAVSPHWFIDPQTTGYGLTAMMPTAQARTREEALIARVRAVDGEVWLPSRPWYARLAGKRPLAGEMGAVDVTPTGVTIAGLDAALRTRRFAAVVVDDPYTPLIAPVFARSTATRFEGARVLVGRRHPTWWLTPR